MDLRSPDWISPALVATGGPAPCPAVQPEAATYAVEIRTPAEMEPEVGAWRDLARRAVEANVFAEPELVLPGIQHLPDGRGVVLLLVWEGAQSTAAGGILRGVLPLIVPRLPVVRRVRLWRPVLAAPGVPLLDRHAPIDVLEAGLAYLAARYPKFKELAFPHVPADGAFAAVLRTAAAHTRRTLEPSRVSARYTLAGAPGEAEGMRRKLLDGLREGRQRLAVLGEVEMDRARTARWVRDAVEELLVLEASGAAKRGRALLQTTGMASFLRIVTRQLAHAGRCRVDVLRVGGRAAAAAIVIESGQQAWLWHIAADASLTGFAPEAQLIRDVTRTEMDRPGPTRTEACEGCCNATVMQDIWQKRSTVDYRIGIQPQASVATLANRIGEGFKQGLRFAARDAYSRPACL